MTTTAESHEKSPNVWFITGTSSGFGSHLVNVALERGDCVIATARDISKITTRFPTSNRLRILQLDVTQSAESIKDLAKEAVSFWGRVDVLVNNAGWAELGFLEEAGSESFKRQMDVNFFGVVNVTLAFIPYMREARSGTIVQIGSRLAWYAERPHGGAAMYSSSKAAVHAFSEALAVELEPFNVRTLIVQPGGFLTGSVAVAPFLKFDNPIADYDGARIIANHQRTDSAIMKRTYLGDPKKLVSFIADLVRGEGTAQGKSFPRYFVCGPASAENVLRKCTIMENAVREWEWMDEELLLDDAEVQNDG